MVLDILSIIISSVAFVVAVFAYRQAWKLRISSIYTELVQQANLINDAFSKYEIESPYHVLLRDSCPVGEFGKREALFFHHINLLDIVFRNQKYLKEEVKRYEIWIQKIFKPWVESDPCLKSIWKKVKESEDILGEKFLTWLKQFL